MITLNEFKTDYLAVPTSEVTYDTLLQRLIDTAVEQLEQYCSQSLLQASKTFEYIRYSSVIGLDEIYRVPLTITNVSDKDAMSDTYTTNTNYAVETDGRNYRLFFSVIPKRIVRVQCTVGYTASTAPAPLKEATGRLAFELFKGSHITTAEANTFGVDSISNQTPAGTTSIKLVPLSKSIRDYVSDWRIQ